MKKYITIFVFCTTLIACNNNSNVEATQKTTTSPLERARDLSYRIFDYMDRCDSKEITKATFDQTCKPMQKELDSLIKTMTFFQNEELKEYRTKLLSDLVTKKAARDSNK